jgi:hypothetical protein
MCKRILLPLFFLISVTLCVGQERIPINKAVQDSICQFGKRYDKPERSDINFPEKQVSDEYKINEIHRAIPDSLSNEDSEKWWFYYYFFDSKVIDYEPLGDSIFTPVQDNFLYKLKDTYFFDINGDGLLDFIHYPKYYMKIARNDIDAYELFLQTKNGYEWVTFRGFITEIKFNKDGTLDSIITFQGSCCDDIQSFFYYYTFNKSENNLTLTKFERVFNCQFNNK